MLEWLLEFMLLNSDSEKTRFHHENEHHYKKIWAFLLFYCKITYIMSNLLLPEIIVLSFREKEQKIANALFALFS